jgi:ubiquitin-conjugating enzyme E2 W
MEKRFVNRLTRDLQTMEKNYKDQFPVIRPNDDLKVWHVTLYGAKGTIYEGEKFT